MKVEIIAVGNEIITGSTVNTNASYIASEIEKIGLTPRWHTSVGDYKEDIFAALKVALARAKVIIFTGGLGPTEDDLTKEAVCEYLGLTLEVDQDALEKIELFFRRLNKVMTTNNIKQACFPSGVVVIPNDNGTAPGCIIPYDDSYVVLLPGPPKELKPMFTHSIVPYFSCHSKGVYHQEEVRVFGIGESQLVEEIKEFLGETEDTIVAPYIGKNEIIIRIKTFGKDTAQAKHKAINIRNSIERSIPQYIIGYNERGVEELVVKRLLERGEVVATAESCTGGLLAGTLINVSGASGCYKEGAVTYSNEAKIKRLGVATQTLADYGAVSTQTASEMARGIRIRSEADIGLSTTGVAGPLGGTPEKPVGLVYVAISTEEGEEVHELRLSGSRTQIREKVVKHTLAELYKKIK